MIAIGSDHGGFELKKEIMKYLEDNGFEYKDYGTYTPDSCDYPVYAKKVVKAVADAKYYQLYYDQFLPSAVGEDIKDATAGIFAGTLTPQQACDKIQKSWEANK